MAPRTSKATSAIVLLCAAAALAWKSRGGLTFSLLLGAERKDSQTNFRGDAAAQLPVTPQAASSLRAAAAAAIGAAAATLAVSSISVRRSRGSSRIAMGPKSPGTDQEAALDLTGDFFKVISDTDWYIEDDRRFRRPVFGYADWKRHRSSERFLRNLKSLPVSTTIRANWQEVLTCTLVASLVLLWNDTDRIALLGPNLPEFVKSMLSVNLVLPALPFTVSSAALSLLLVFRTNQSYARWWEARCIWGAIINTCRDIVRQALARFDPKDVELKEQVTRLVSAYPRSLIYHVGERTPISDEVVDKKYSKILKPDEKEKLMGCTHKPMTVTGMLSDCIRKANLPVIDEMKIDQDITKFSDYYGMCERIFKTPMPLSYTRLTSRFLSVWLLFMPLALYSQVQPHWAIIPITSVLAFFIFGIEEIGIAIEEPFSVLPMSAMADGIDASIFEALELDKKENAKELQHAS